MAAETGRMCVSARRYRKGNSSLRRLVADGAIYAAMPSVIEPSAKAAKPGKAFHGAATRIGVADSADRARAIRELQAVTADARRVAVAAGKRHTGCRGIAPVTQQTGHARMVLVRVSKT